jgi:class 3 adenylate cyclase
MIPLQRNETRVVLFADVCGSTSLYDQLGDAMARRLIGQCMAIMSHAVVGHEGLIIKTLGDEILCIFPTPDAGLLAACAMQKAVQATEFEGGNRLQIRIGFHYGSFICENGDIFGDTVNVAARIAAMANKGQILTSQALVDALPAASKVHTKRLMAAEFKGKQDEFAIFVVNWDEDDSVTTQILNQSPLAGQTNRVELTLKYGDTTWVVNKDKKQLMTGRGNTCDIMIASNLASRQHAVIEFRQGKFFITDQSANGTWVRTSDGHVEQITRQELVLRGSGLISLGQAFTSETMELISYWVLA